MPSRKLKSALLSHQSAVARRATQSKAAEHRQAKALSIKSTLSGSSSKPKSKGKSKLTSKPDGSQSHPTTIPIDNTDTILLLGEANFSFALSLLPPPHSFSPRQICATSYDSEDLCYSKYPDARDHVAELRESGVRVGFGVDAGALEKSKVVGTGRRWSRVVFNFPHVGAGITDQDRNILSNQHLLLRTFRSVAPLLTDGPSAFPIPTKTKGKSSKRKSPPDTDSEPDFDLHPEDDFEPPFQPTDTSRTLQSLQPPPRQGTLLITLLSQAPYTLWDLPHLATRPPPLCPGTTLPQPKYRLLRSFQFRPEVYQGYEHRRTIGWREGLSRGRNEEILGRKGRGRTWEFALAGED